MASIYLYDIDLLHSTRFAPPNLELMKVFNYHYQRGDIVKMGMPKENDLGRYNQIIYFKNNPKQTIPKHLSLSGEQVQIYAYGFYRKFTPLKPEIAAMPPSYFPYTGEIEKKIKKPMQFKHIEKNSLIRIENNDFTDFKEDCAYIYVADENFLYTPNAEDFVKEYKRNYNIRFLHPLIAKDEEAFRKFFPIANISDKRMIVDFKFSKDFFENYYYENIFFAAEPRKSDVNPSVYLQRIVKMILIAKHGGKRIQLTQQKFNQIELRAKPLLVLWEDIFNWSRSKEQESFYEFYGKNKDISTLEDIVASKRNLRLLLKQNPKTLDTRSIDFWE